jgi:hypothetical protein
MHLAKVKYTKFLCLSKKIEKFWRLLDLLDKILKYLGFVQLSPTKSNYSWIIVGVSWSFLETFQL